MSWVKELSYGGKKIPFPS